MKKTFAAVAVCALALSGALRADDKATGPPKPAAEMSQLAYFNGTWNCSGKVFASPFGPEHASEGVAHAKLTLGGFWTEIHYDENKSEANKMPYHVVQYFGYDPAQKVFISHCFDAMGSTCSQTSPGWKDGVFALEGTSLMMGQKGMGRDTFTKVSATEMKHAGSIQGPDGKWMQTDEETCQKAAAKEPAKK